MFAEQFGIVCFVCVHAYVCICVLLDNCEKYTFSPFVMGILIKQK